VRSERRLRVARAPLLLLAMLCLLAGMLGGLARLGWDLVPTPSGPLLFHGPLMVAGFLGTVIGLERAVSYGRLWSYLAPLGTGAGALLLALGGAERPARGLVALGSGVMLATLAIAARRLPVRWTTTQLLGAASFAVGSGLWALGWPLLRVLPWWEAFLVLIIAGERLELSRLLQPTRAALGAFAGSVGLLLLGAAVSSVESGVALRLGGLAWLALALWFARWDLARRSLRRPGLPRFMAAAILSGHLWLGVAGLLALAFGARATQAGLANDAVVHALFLGFAFAMIMGHAPVIFPSVLGLPAAFRGRFWAHLALLHAGVLLRVASDLAGSTAGRGWGAALNVAAILFFLLNTASALARPSAAGAFDGGTSR
jgi:hypothetical protein